MTTSPDFPRAFGEYQLLSTLGRGGMGEVFLARRPGIAGADKVCVLKCSRDDVDDGDYTRRFLDEMRVVTALSHKNICPVFDVGRVDNRAFLAMGFVAGVDLRAVLRALRRAEEKLDRALVAYLLHEVLEALDYAHRAVDLRTHDSLDVVHRDVSPQNIMISFEGEIQLIDFGLAQSTLKSEETESEVVMGKVRYMAPEQLDGDGVTAKVDQYAAGILLYELLSGGRYWADLENRQIWNHLADGSYRPPLWTELDGETRALLAPALAAHPDDRYPSCAAFRAALDSWAHAQNLRGGAAAMRAAIAALLPEAEAASRQATRAALDADVKQPASPIVPTTTTEAVTRDNTQPTDALVRHEHGRKRWAWAAAAMMVALIATVGWLRAQDRDAVAETPVPIAENIPPLPHAESQPAADKAAATAEKEAHEAVLPPSASTRSRTKRVLPIAETTSSRAANSTQRTPRLPVATSSAPNSVDDHTKSGATNKMSPRAPHTLLVRDALTVLSSCDLPCAGILRRQLGRQSNDVVPAKAVFSVRSCMSSCDSSTP